MKETLYLSNKNIGYWSIYRKKCFDRNNHHVTNDSRCQKLFQLLFKKSSEPFL